MDEEYQAWIIFGVGPGSTVEEVKSAYRALARKWHPDRVHHDERGRREAEEKLRRINRAYRTLLALMELETREPPRGRRPANPGYDPVGWRASAAESGRAAETLEDDRSFYRRPLELHLRGMDHYRQGRFRDAVSALMQSVCLVQNNAEAYRTIARAHRRLNQPAKAVWAYEQAVLLDPDAAEARYELAVALLAIGDQQAARREMDTLRGLDPELSDLLAASLEGSR